VNIPIFPIFNDWDLGVVSQSQLHRLPWLPMSIKPPVFFPTGTHSSSSISYDFDGTFASLVLVLVSPVLDEPLIGWNRVG
jgi:hypothetical protein